MRESSGRHEYDGKPQDLSRRASGPGWPGWRQLPGIALHEVAPGQRFHKALLDLGAPPLGLLGTALERG